MYSTGDYTQYFIITFVITYKGKESEKNIYIYIHIYIKLNHCAVYLKLTGHFKSTILQLKKRLALNKLNRQKTKNKPTVKKEINPAM